MKSLEKIDTEQWNTSFSKNIQDQAVKALENGKILFFPKLKFNLSPEEKLFLSPEKADPKTKNISYDIHQDLLKGTTVTGKEEMQLKEMIKRFAKGSRQLLESLIPHYKEHLSQARTSFRPVEIEGRKSSYRKDDTRLHVDSFPASPVKGKRILRVFTNINPSGRARVWRVGEPFEDVVAHMAPKASHPIPGAAFFLNLFKITKGQRTPYDHYMLQIHDNMKGDERYQQTAPQEEIAFPPGSSWIVYTDQVSHAAMSGQHVLEQTFYLPLEGLKFEETAPVRVLERYFKKALL